MENVYLQVNDDFNGVSGVAIKGVESGMTYIHVPYDVNFRYLNTFLDQLTVLLDRGYQLVKSSCN
jgi:hypothetical protein